MVQHIYERGCAENEKDDGGDEDDEDGVVMKTMEMRMMMIGMRMMRMMMVIGNIRVLRSAAANIGANIQMCTSLNIQCNDEG